MDIFNKIMLIIFVDYNDIAYLYIIIKPKVMKTTMKKLEIGTKVIVNLSSANAQKLGINGSILCEGEITGHYPLGHYIKVPERKTPVAIADKYGAIKPKS